MRDVPEGLIPDEIAAKYEIHNWRNAVQVLATSYPAEWEDILEVFGALVLGKSDVLAPGGNKSAFTRRIDKAFVDRGWREREVAVQLRVDDAVHENRSHKIDCWKNRVGLELEWNSKDQTFVRDLNNFRILFEFAVMDVGVILTRASHLQEVFNELGIGGKYGESTTHMGKLLPRLSGGGGGGCPVVVFGITKAMYDANS